MLHISREFDLKVLGRSKCLISLRHFTRIADIEADVNMLDARLSVETLIQQDNESIFCLDSKMDSFQVLEALQLLENLVCKIGFSLQLNTQEFQSILSD